MVETLRLVQQLVKQAIDLTPDPPPRETYDFLYSARVVVFATNKSLYRCYVIWGRQKKVLILPGGLIISTVDPPAGRIWMKRCEAVYIGADLLKNRYNTAIAIMALYCTFLILLAITRQSRMTWIVLNGALAHLMNIIPALIIVRAGLCHNIQDKIESQASRTTPSRGGERQKPSFEVLDLKPRAGKCIETV
ncbi:hypothetical protein B0H14DRAFT_2577564 [Mycena olivaceomarginata]|nr:hypothetical protein B0H14DRAFT_2577564 [Mycena olivaceomarginata]